MYTPSVPTLPTTALPLLWLGLGVEAPRVDPLGGELFGGTLGLGVEVGSVMWIELRAGAAAIPEPAPSRMDLMMFDARNDGVVYHHDRAGWGEVRLGFAPLLGTLGGGSSLGAGVFVGGGAVSVVEWATWDLELQPAGLAPTTLIGLTTRLRWVGRGVSAEVYAEAFDRSWIYVFRSTNLELQHDTAFGVGFRLAVGRTFARR